MTLILFAKIIKNGWFDSEDDKNSEHRELVAQIIHKIVKVVSPFSFQKNKSKLEIFCIRQILMRQFF